MMYAVLLTIFYVLIKGDDKYVKSLLRQIRSTKKVRSAGFEESIPRKVRVARNEIAFLTCMVKNIINESVIPLFLNEFIYKYGRYLPII